MAEERANGGGRVEQLLERRLRTIPAEVSDALGTRLRAALEAVQDRATGGLDGLRSALAGLEERLAGTLGALAEGLDALPDGTRGAVDAAMERLRGDLETIHGIPQQIARALTIVRDAVSEIAAAQEAVGARLGALSEEMAAGREEIVERARVLDERIAAVERLGGVIDSLAQKRGFKDLVATEKRAMDQQERFVDRLVSLGEELASHTQELKERVDDLTVRVEEVSARIGGLEGGAEDRGRLAHALEDLRDRVAAELSQGLDRVAETVASVEGTGGAETAPVALPVGIAGELIEQVGAHVAAVLDEHRPQMAQGATARELKEVVKAQHALEKGVRATQAELERIRKRLDSWGRARSAPRLADELAGLEERVIDLEQGEVTDDVLDRVQRFFDRRFEALVQLIDARTGPAAVATRDGPRGLFRRR